MQSGITASQELASQFNTLLGSGAHFGLLVTIAKEQLLPLALLTASSPASSFASNITSLLTPHVKTNEALYIILRRYSSAPALVAVTYVPDAAPVRQKMLFAATRLTLVRELGSEHFRETIFATLPTELTPAGFEKHDAHNALDAPLTEEERTLGDVKRAEQEAGVGTGAREIHLSKNLAMPVTEEVLGGLKELAAGGGTGLIMLKINPETEVVELVPSSAAPSSIPELVDTISATEPRFTFYRYSHGADSPVLFFYTCPTKAGTKAIKFRMMYPLMKRAVLAIAEKEAGLQIEKKFEVEEPAEITEESVLEELHPKVEAKKVFSRPKRPGR
ncbi:hypothetical protein B0H67DRAFT_491361 [Lasiosphaeris hirsuta]|uniref:ADF-H domain-containing protein n=1 Tax=Lasiosphaeris hirsuta TaxID=260670 RepID=A0AA40A9P0_9PEZI|nr:hypothetical protein B0H67DRAFT_491361 [Lasiosphaeris hirsuta]